MTARARLFLVDGYALIYRAFFAMMQRPLTTSRGENTSAAWGVSNFLLRLLDEQQPDLVAWVHDAGDSFRKETYPEYKATREKLDDELQEEFDQSLRRVGELLTAWRIPLLAVPGYEADDVIGTLATQAVNAGLDVTIVSGDKDLYQLIAPHVRLLNPGRGGPAAVEQQVIDESNAAERLGVSPDRVVDYLALVGDSSDNVPGVRGVGDKTARALIGEYGDLDAILAHVDDVANKRAREALQRHGEDAKLSRELVTIQRDVPVELDVDALRRQAPDRRSLVKLFTELEFHSLVPRVEAAMPAPKPAQYTLDVVLDPDRVASVVEELKMAPLVACDLVLDGGGRSTRLVGLSAAMGPERAWYFPFGHGTEQGDLVAAQDATNLPALDAPAMEPLRRFLEEDRPKAFHSVKDAIRTLRRVGIHLGGAAFDSMLASFLLQPGRRSHDLDGLGREYLGRTLIPRERLVGKGRQLRPIAETAPEAAARYSGDHSTTILDLASAFRAELESTQLDRLLKDIEMPLAHVLADMEWRGIRIDGKYFTELQATFGQEVDRLVRVVYEAAGSEFNINSTPQLRFVLFEKLLLPVIKKTKTGPSTDAEVLEQLAATGHSVPRLILEYRELSKLKSTYVDALPDRVNRETGRIHTTFNQTGAATGRLSSSDPNLQNIPVRTPRGELIRKGFVPADGHLFLVADYSQIELRLLAHLSGDRAFVDAFGQGGDIHKQTAAVIFETELDDVTAEMRAQAKTINFATIYGQGPFALARQLGISNEEARDFITQYFERFAGVRAWLDRTIHETRDRGYVETIFGRRRYVPEINDRKHNVRAFGERTATNSPLQGSAADLIKVAMIRIHEALTRDAVDAAVLLQVHDELVVEVGEADVEKTCAVVRTHMESAAELTVPLVVDIGVGRDWLEAKA